MENKSKWEISIPNRCVASILLAVLIAGLAIGAVIGGTYVGMNTTQTITYTGVTVCIPHTETIGIYMNTTTVASVTTVTTWYTPTSIMIVHLNMTFSNNHYNLTEYLGLASLSGQVPVGSGLEVYATFNNASFELFSLNSIYAKTGVLHFKATNEGTYIAFKGELYIDGILVQNFDFKYESLRGD